MPSTKEKKYRSIRYTLFLYSLYILILASSLSLLLSFLISSRTDLSNSQERLGVILRTLDPSLARAAYQINDGAVQTLLDTIAALPEVRGASFRGELQSLASPAGVSEEDIFSQCDQVYERDLSGFSVGNEVLPSGLYRVCAEFSSVNKNRTSSFYWMILPQLLLVLVVSLSFIYLVHRSVISRIVRLRRRIQRSDDALLNLSVKSQRHDELEDLENALAERTRSLYLETATAGIVFENVDDGIAFTDLNDVITRCNERFRVLFPKYMDNTDVCLLDLFDRIEHLSPGVWSKVDVRFAQTEMEVEAYLVKVEVPNVHSGRVYIFRDLTEKRKIERRAAQAQRVSAIGSVSSGVAHDFNNLLGVIMGYAELGLRDASLPSRQQKIFEHIRRSAGRGAALTDKLMTFARRQKLSKVRINPVAVVKQTAELAKRLIGPSTTINLRTNSSHNVEADPTYLESSLLNLIVNARDAMPRGGEMTLLAENTQTNGQPMVAFRVCDNGIGIPEEIIEKVHEPFFTTKESGKGTGLGLSMVAGFAEQSGGALEVLSEPGKTCVSILLPATDLQVEENEEFSSNFARSDFQRKKILIVDDEESFANVQKEILEMSGFEVNALNSLSDVKAISQLSQYDLVLCDVVLVGRYGNEVWDYFRGKGVNTPFMFMSGNIPRDAEDLIRQTREPIISKPFTVDELLTAIDLLLAPRQQ